MTETTNEYVDEAILSKIKECRHVKFVSLRFIADYRQVDRRLQALRRAGKIRFDTKLGWMLP
jgi:hypothetical protein